MRAAIVLILVLLFHVPATAQTIEPSIGAGQVGLDEYHPAVAGSVRIYVIRGFSIDPDLLYVRGTSNNGTRRSGFQFGPSFAYTFRRQSNVAPYAIFGAHFGKLRLESPCEVRCFPSRSITWNTGSGGGGVRLRFGEHFFVSPEFRLMVDQDAVGLRFMVNVGAILSR